MLQEKEQIQSERRETKLKKNDRWATFKVRRQEVIDDYIKMKKRQKQISELLVLVVRRRYIKKSIENYEEYRE